MIKRINQMFLFLMILKSIGREKKLTYRNRIFREKLIIKKHKLTLPHCSRSLQALNGFRFFAQSKL